MKNIHFTEECYCEHCGKLEPYTPVFYDTDSGCDWCLYCAESNGDITEKEIEEAEKKGLELKIQFFCKRIQESQNELNKLTEKGK